MIDQEQFDGSGKVVVIGGGPVGILTAISFASRGNAVEVYELRSDLRNESDGIHGLREASRSINLALSARGIAAIKRFTNDDVVESLLSNSVRVYGRMIHNAYVEGDKVKDMNKLNDELSPTIQAYDVHQRYISAIPRKNLTLFLLKYLERFKNAKVYFDNRLIGADFSDHTVHIERTASKNAPQGLRSQERVISVKYDLLVGADGAHSMVRRLMSRLSRMDIHQQYMNMLWCEFVIPSSAESGEYRLPPNYLHIWPAEDQMFIAIANNDGTFTATLFMPPAEFKYLEQNTHLIAQFIKSHYPNILDRLIEEQDFIDQFTRNPHLPIFQLKCSPFHLEPNVVLIGDAAHVIAPFYGQGLNAGLEDVSILHDFLTATHIKAMDSSPSSALFSFTSSRIPCIHAITDMSLNNYTEMASSVCRPFYRMSKFLDDLLMRILPPHVWQSQYALVTFSLTPYSLIPAILRRQRWLFASSLAVPVCIFAGYWINRLRR